MTTTDETRIKSVLAEVTVLLIKNIQKYNNCFDVVWNETRDQIVTTYSVTEYQAAMMMRAAMSLFNGEIHPAFK